MAIVQIDVANPTSADVTVNAKTAKARMLTKLGLDNATNEAYQFLAANCALAGEGATFEQREQGGFIIQHDVQDIQ